MRHLPADYEHLRDNPVRAAVELAFKHAGIEGGWMRDYVEFRLARRLLNEGLLDRLKHDGVVAASAHELPAELAIDPRVTARVGEALRAPAVQQMLREEALDSQSGERLSHRLNAIRKP
jgi:hypothetical protein